MMALPGIPGLRAAQQEAPWKSMVPRATSSLATCNLRPGGSSVQVPWELLRPLRWVIPGRKDHSHSPTSKRRNRGCSLLRRHGADRDRRHGCDAYHRLPEWPTPHLPWRSDVRSGSRRTTRGRFTVWPGENSITKSSDRTLHVLTPGEGEATDHICASTGRSPNRHPPR
jgi:hypothetical protein